MQKWRVYAVLRRFANCIVFQNCHKFEQTTDIHTCHPSFTTLQITKPLSHSQFESKANAAISSVSGTAFNKPFRHRQESRKGERGWMPPEWSYSSSSLWGYSVQGIATGDGARNLPVDTQEQPWQLKSISQETLILRHHMATLYQHSPSPGSRRKRWIRRGKIERWQSKKGEEETKKRAQFYQCPIFWSSVTKVDCWPFLDSPNRPLFISTRVTQLHMSKIALFGSFHCFSYPVKSSILQESGECFIPIIFSC